MTSFTRWTTIAVYISVLMFFPANQADAIEDAIIAVVNDELITLKDLKDYVQSTYVSLVAEGVSDQKIQEILKDMEVNGTNKLIEDKLIISKANEVGLEVREDLVDKEIDTIQQKYGSEQDLVDALVKSGATLTDLRNKIRDQLKIKFIIDHEVRSKIYINPQEVTEYYEKNKQKFARKDRINLDSIFVAYNSDKDAAQAKIQEIFGQIKEGADFQSLIDKYSDTPSVGSVERGQLLPEVEKVVFNLKMDEISPAIHIDTGIFIFKLIGKNPANIPSIEEVKDEIRDMLEREKFKTHFLKWLAELKEEAYIEIKK